MLMTAIMLCSCATTLKSSRFTSTDLQPGTSKETVLARFGKPFKESFSNTGGILYEDLYYKEIIHKSMWFEVNSILHFKEGKLVSLEQGEEKNLYQPALKVEK